MNNYFVLLTKKDQFCNMIGPFNTRREAEFYANNGDYSRNFTAKVFIPSEPRYIRNPP